MNYICIIDGLLEFGSNDINDFGHYIAMYQNEIFESLEKGGKIEMLGINDEEYSEMFPVEDEE